MSPEQSGTERRASDSGVARRRRLQSLFRGVTEHELLTRAAALSFYFIFALFPIALSLLALLGIYAQDPGARIAVVRQLSYLLPSAALSLIQTTIRELIIYSSGWKLLLGLGLALWSGSGGMSCIMESLNRSRGLRDSRPWWKRQIVSLGLTALISGCSLLALTIVLVGGDLAEFVGRHTGLSRATLTLWETAQWPIAVFVMLLSLDLTYCWGPAVRRRWRWFTWGSVTGVTVWIVVSLLFRVYLHYFSNYSRSYGSLGAVMVLLIWLYWTGMAILLGGEINAELDQA